MLTVKHPWHGATFGEKAPATVNALIEIPQGSRSKYEVDKDTGLLRLDRVIYSSFQYPINYGFIPQTLGQDNDPLDILVLCSQSIQSLCLVEANVIGNINFGHADFDEGKCFLENLICNFDCFLHAGLFGWCFSSAQGVDDGLGADEAVCVWRAMG